LFPEESVLPCVRRERRKNIWYVKKKKSIENKSIFSPTLMTTLNSLIQLQNDIIGLGFKLMFSSLTTSEGYFLLIPTAVS